MSGAICGGVISESQQEKDMKKYGVWANAMSYVMPDKQYEEYVSLVREIKRPPPSPWGGGKP